MLSYKPFPALETPVDECPRSIILPSQSLLLPSVTASVTICGNSYLQGLSLVRMTAKVTLKSQKLLAAVFSVT